MAMSSMLSARSDISSLMAVKFGALFVRVTSHGMYQFRTVSVSDNSHIFTSLQLAKEIMFDSAGLSVSSMKVMNGLQ